MPIGWCRVDRVSSTPVESGDATRHGGAKQTVLLSTRAKERTRQRYQFPPTTIRVWNWVAQNTLPSSFLALPLRFSSSNGAPPAPPVRFELGLWIFCSHPQFRPMLATCSRTKSSTEALRRPQIAQHRWSERRHRWSHHTSPSQIVCAVIPCPLFFLFSRTSSLDAHFDLLHFSSGFTDLCSECILRVVIECSCDPLSFLFRMLFRW